YLLLFALAPGSLFLWHLLGLFGTDPSTLHRMFLLLKSFIPPDPKVQDILDSAMANVVVTGSSGLLANAGIILGIYFGTVFIATLNLPFTFVALVILALALYLLTPENYLTIRQALPGAIFFAVGWIIATKLFQFYVGRYDRYNPTYLALASIVVLLTWMYLTCLLLLLGGKLNAILRREAERMRRAAPRTLDPSASTA